MVTTSYILDIENNKISYVSSTLAWEVSADMPKVLPSVGQEK